MSVLIGFLPWILFWFLVGADEFEVAAVAGLVASVIWLGWTHLEGKAVKILDVGGFVFFAVMTVLAATADDDWFARWSYVLSDAALAAVILLSILLGNPFTRQYAKEGAPPEIWETAAFKHTTLVLTWMWFAILVANIVLAWLAVEFPDEELWLGLVAPISLVIVGLRLNHWYPDHVRRATAPAVAAEASAGSLQSPPT